MIPTLTMFIKFYFAHKNHRESLLKTQILTREVFSPVLQGILKEMV